MRYEARLTAYDMLDQIHVALVVTTTPEEGPGAPSTVLAMTATARSRGISGATDWTREVLDTMRHAVGER